MRHIDSIENATAIDVYFVLSMAMVRHSMWINVNYQFMEICFYTYAIYLLHAYIMRSTYPVTLYSVHTWLKRNLTGVFASSAISNKSNEHHAHEGMKPLLSIHLIHAILLFAFVAVGVAVLTHHSTIAIIKKWTLSHSYYMRMRKSNKSALELAATQFYDTYKFRVVHTVHCTQR